MKKALKVVVFFGAIAIAICSGAYIVTKNNKNFADLFNYNDNTAFSYDGCSEDEDYY